VKIKSYIKEAKWANIIIILGVVALYLVLYASFFKRLWPEYSKNVSVIFADTAWEVLFMLTAGLFLILFILLTWTKRNCTLILKSSVDKVSIKDLILVLLPLTPVVQYILNNQDVLSPAGSLYALSLFMMFAVVFIILLPVVLSIVSSTAAIMAAGVAFTFTITNMAILSAEFHWFQEGDFFIQITWLMAVFLICWALLKFASREAVYIIVLLFFLASNISPFITSEQAEGKARTTLSRMDNKLIQTIGASKPVVTPNIYLLTYDSYVGNETMEGYGINNSTQVKYLEGLGFKLCPSVYSIYAESILSMSPVLNVSTSFYGNGRRAVSGDGVVQNIFKSMGYETYGIFPTTYYFQDVGSSYDHSFPVVEGFAASLSSHKSMVLSILMGEFRFDTDISRPPYDGFLKYKSEVFNTTPSMPRFIYMHTYFPGHSQNSGACRPNEVELYGERLDIANKEMRRDIEAILSNDADALIVVCGDHGAYLTKNCTNTSYSYDISEIDRLDIQDRFGVFLAIRTPTGEISDDIYILQDVFPVIFKYMFNNPKILETRLVPDTYESEVTSGAFVNGGIIHGGINDGEQLFEGK